MISAWEVKDVKLFASIMALSLVFSEHFIVKFGQVLGFQEMIRLLFLLVSGTYKVLLCLRGLYPCKVGWAPGLSLVKGKVKSRPMRF